MRTFRLIPVLGLVAALMVGCSAGPAAPPPGSATATLGSGSDATATPANGSESASAPAAPATDGGGSGTAHYEITGPDAASGDVKFARSAVSSDPYIQSVLFQDGSSVIRINFPHVAPCVPDFRAACGTVGISTATLSLQDPGWRALPLPGGPSCTWDTASLTANGGTGSVECINAVNPVDPTTPDRITVMFTYHDPSPGLL